MFGFKKKAKSAKRATQRRTQRPQEKVTTRLVMSRRWVRSNQLEMGMFVCELDRPWSETRFLFQGFKIDSNELLSQLENTCEYVKVESLKVAQISSNSPNRLVGDVWKGSYAV